MLTDTLALPRGAGAGAGVGCAWPTGSGRPCPLPCPWARTGAAVATANVAAITARPKCMGFLLCEPSHDASLWPESGESRLSPLARYAAATENEETTMAKAKRAAAKKVKPKPANPRVFNKGLAIRRQVLGKQY